ncbi:ATP-binding cassette domain-containing protein [Actinoallomurus sp. NPDC052308]|uniref:ATP-binding cassette domain-containing protein n=1 Tax=Actinoallomurus sp. NPDC052308 TaxID=3155530 RepID=UPI00342B309A
MRDDVDARTTGPVAVDGGWREVGERLRVLRRIPELGGLPRRRLRELEPELRLVEVGAGDVVCEEAGPADRLVAVASGELDGPVTTVDGRYGRTVRALTPARLWTLPADTARGALRATAETGTAGLRIDVRGVGRHIGGRRTLQDISLTIEPGELVAIVGASGSGKTTLLDAVSGVRPPTTGEVRLDGDPDSFGYVPQDDIIHRELPLARTLRYAARLRLPAGTSADRVDEAVGRVLRALDLTDRADTRVGSLSGGERKRASIAVDLLTRPRVLFLDEPTSGLDPATAADFMRLLRRLAGAGSTVVVTTHDPPDVALCDKVVFLTTDGRLAFFGTPDAARTYFQTDHIEEVYERLADEDTPEEWARRFTAARGVPEDPPAPSGEPAAAGRPAPDRRPAAGRRPMPDRRPAAGRRPAPGPRAPAGRRSVRALRQWRVLTRRDLDILLRDRLTAAILAGSPVMVLLMFAVLFRPHAFSYARPSPAATVMILFWIAFGGFFFGLTYGLLQICTERAILCRERLAGLGIAPYVAAKVAVLLPLLAVADAVMLLVLRALDRLPAAGWSTYGELFVTLLLTSAAGLGLGLLISAVVGDPAQATMALPMLCFPQVLFVGAILPVPVMAVAGRVLSYGMSNRWAFEALGHSLGVARLWAHGRSPLGPPLLASYGATFSRPVVVDWVILTGFTALFLALTCVVLARGTAYGRR